MIAVLLLAAAPAPAAGLDASALEALRAIDLRLATIAHRLVIGNVALCRDRSPATGLVLHAATQYDAATAGAARATFGFSTPIAVEAVVAGSAGARAGIAANDGIVALEETKLVATATPPSSIDRDRALDLFEQASSPVRVTIDRGGARRPVAIDAPAACRARFEVLLGPEMTAQSDGRIVQIGVRFFERYRDDEVAVVVAHELAHTILRHRVRLEAAGVKGGLLGELGRNARLGQQAETEADELGVALLYNAGYDVASAARFWRERGGDIDGGLFRSRTHPATKQRIEAIERAAAAVPARRPYLPAILATRDQPFGK
ncbi:M48 family metallopeptidase [Sphingomonas sp. NBWT7]|uniref:M48 family metallopeptidase n=1 Tax=Sphingomonas sp. NBWT7 TaxID=2596913 RepID=UPI0021563570|nr:M48 family metalloprotease [Sphingomonas sp. NBWT7]